MSSHSPLPTPHSPLPNSMAYSDLREFIKVLEKNKELKRVTVPVSSDQEISACTCRVSKSKENNKALLFENVDGGEIPVLINALGSRRRMELALEVSSVEDVAARLTEWLDFKSPEGLLEKVKMLPKLAELRSEERRVGKEWSAG